MEAHLLWEQGGEGSNPFAPTIKGYAVITTLFKYMVTNLTETFSFSCHFPNAPPPAPCQKGHQMSRHRVDSPPCHDTDKDAAGHCVKAAGSQRDKQE